jgi:L-xylulokinase
MLADVPGLPVRLGEAEETGALGGAIAAAVGIGWHGDEAAAVAALTRPRAVLLPDPARSAVHDRRFAVWQRLTAALEPFWADLQELGNDR